MNYQKKRKLRKKRKSITNQNHQSLLNPSLNRQNQKENTKNQNLNLNPSEKPKNRKEENTIATIAMLVILVLQRKRLNAH